MSQTNIEADPFLKLLTDALRAGPGSPEWHQAVAQLREGGRGRTPTSTSCSSPPASTSRAARSTAPSAPAPASPASCSTAIEEERRHGATSVAALPTATVIAVACGLVIVAVVAFVGWHLWHRAARRAAARDRAGPGARPTSRPRSRPRRSTAGDRPRRGEASASCRWSRARAACSRSPAPPAAPPPRSGAGSWRPRRSPADEPFAAEVTLLPSGKPAEDVIVEVLRRRPTPTFSPDRATSPAELVWLPPGRAAAGGQGRLRPDRAAGRPTPPGRDQDRSRRDAAKPGDAARETLTVRILVNRDAAIVECERPAPLGRPPRPARQPALRRRPLPPQRRRQGPRAARRFSRSGC